MFSGTKPGTNVKTVDVTTRTGTAGIVQQDIQARVRAGNAVDKVGTLARTREARRANADTRTAIGQKSAQAAVQSAVRSNNARAGAASGAGIAAVTAQGGGKHISSTGARAQRGNQVTSAAIQVRRGASSPADARGQGQACSWHQRGRSGPAGGAPANRHRRPACPPPFPPPSPRGAPPRRLLRGVRRQRAPQRRQARWPRARHRFGPLLGLRRRAAADAARPLLSPPRAPSCACSRPCGAAVCRAAAGREVAPGGPAMPATFLHVPPQQLLTITYPRRACFPEHRRLHIYEFPMCEHACHIVRSTLLIGRTSRWHRHGVTMCVPQAWSFATNPGPGHSCKGGLMPQPWLAKA